ncbi:MAG: hypothetical protein HZB34_16425, partial [Nitrospirae bacterium]|nr:hypothetical protein [Nitrospirota bacterium]
MTSERHFGEKSLLCGLLRLLLLGAHVVGLFSVVALSPAAAQSGKPDGLYYKSWAIIIGIEHYVVAPPIPGAISDAKKVSMQDADGHDRGYLVPFDAQVNNATKSITVEHLKEFTRRSASKHTLLLFDASVFGWETTAPSGLSLEGRQVPESDTERRAVQVMSAAGKGEAAVHSEKSSHFVQTLLIGLSGAADLDGNGWLMASELGTYLARQVEAASNGTQHPVSLRIDGDGDTTLVEGRRSAFTLGAGPRTPSERQQEAQAHYERAFVLLQEGKSGEEALERLDRAIGYDPTFGNAYVLKSYVRLEVVPNLDEALA